MSGQNRASSPPAGAPHGEFASRVERLQRAMRRDGLDVLLLTEHADVKYATGYSVDVLWSSPTRILAAVIPAEGDPALLTPGFVSPEARAVSGWHVETYDSLAAAPVDQVVGLIRSALAADSTRSISARRIGLERAGESRIGLTLATLDELTTAIAGALPDAELVDGMGLVHGVRMWKSQWEIDRLRWACAANQAGLAAAFGHSQDGRSETEVAREILVEGLRAGAGWPAWTIPGWIGMTSGVGNYHRFVEQPTTRRLGSGDMLWTDIGFRVDGYWSDYCRAAVVGGPTRQQEERQRRILSATAAGVQAAVPGATASDVARAVGAELERQGLPGLGFGRVGHGIGLTATEPPSIALHDATVLEAGMVITVEPATVLDDGIYCAEQIVVVGDPPEVLSVAPLELSSI